MPPFRSKVFIVDLQITVHVDGSVLAPHPLLRFTVPRAANLGAVLKVWSQRRFGSAPPFGLEGARLTLDGQPVDTHFSLTAASKVVPIRNGAYFLRIQLVMPPSPATSAPLQPPKKRAAAAGTTTSASHLQNIRGSSRYADVDGVALGYHESAVGQTN